MDLMGGVLGPLPTRVGVHLEVAELGWQAPACHSERELASEGSSATWSLDSRSIGMLPYVGELSYSSLEFGHIL